MSRELKHMTEEADIGSGEQKQGDKETEKEIRKVPKVPEDKNGRTTTDNEKDEEKRKGLVDEDHPFPSKGN